jgi:hypothetical protein
MAKFTQIEKLNTPHNKIGMGRPYTGGQDSRTPQQRFIGDTSSAIRSQNWVIPNVESVRIHFDGPLKLTDADKGFGVKINPLGAIEDFPGASAVETTMAQAGEFQMDVLVMSIGWECQPEPLIFTAKGNSMLTPSNAAPAPVSPDAFDAQDILAGATGPLGIATMSPAWLDWGSWQEIAFFHMANAYNLSWQMGSKNFIVRDSLRNTMYVPSAAQNGSSSSSEQDIQYFARVTNDYYRSVLKSNNIFLPIERTRIGNMILVNNGVTTTGLSVFRPTRAYETVGATYGGMGLRGLLKGNGIDRRLCSPYLMGAGLPIGLRADIALNASNDHQQMINWLTANFGGFYGGADGDPANFQVDTFLSPTGVASVAGGAIGQEPSLDATVAPEPVTTFQNRMGFRGGSWKMSCRINGFELTPEQSRMVRDPNVQSGLTTLGLGGIFVR